MEKYENRQECPIGVFDSGVGGISVLRELVAQMPNENYIFFGDSKNAPYGTKTLEEVQKLTCADAEYLLSRGVKALVVACNTATSAAIRILREKYADMPVIGIEPALKPAVHAGGHPRVLVMATPMTLREEKFHALMQRFYLGVRDIPGVRIYGDFSAPCRTGGSGRRRFSACRVRGWWSMWSRACWRAQNSKRFLQICLNRTKAIRWIVSCLAARIIRLCGRQSRSFSEPECRSLTAERGPRGRQNAGLRIAVCAVAERSKEPWNCATVLRRSR